MRFRILFVCLGNICRSPTAEAVARARIKETDLDIEFDSAGTSGWHIGDAPYSPMQEAASKRGYDMSPLRARKLSAQDFETFDLIIAMDLDNISEAEKIRPKRSLTSIKLLTDYVSMTGVNGVPDPYYTRDFEGALELIEESVGGLIDEFQKVQ